MLEGDSQRNQEIGQHISTCFQYIGDEFEFEKDMVAIKDGLSHYVNHVQIIKERLRHCKIITLVVHYPLIVVGSILTPKDES